MPSCAGAHRNVCDGGDFVTRFFMKTNAPQARFFDERIAPQAKLMKQIAPQARFF